jgi:hypothetical protein
MFPFDAPKNYKEMLNKIGIFTFLSALGLVWLVARFSGPIGATLNSSSTTVDIKSFHVPVLYVIPAAIIAFFAHVFRLHDKISDLFRIRFRFDVNCILIPLANALGLNVDEVLRSKLSARRESAMQRTFYKYASFEEPKISKALVLSAVNTWTWYWILLELDALVLIAGIILLCTEAFAAAACVLVLGGVLAVLFNTCYAVCGKKASYQIEEMVADAARADVLRTEFSAIRAL